MSADIDYTGRLKPRVFDYAPARDSQLHWAQYETWDSGLLATATVQTAGIPLVVGDELLLGRDRDRFRVTELQCTAYSMTGGRRYTALLAYAPVAEEIR